MRENRTDTGTVTVIRQAQKQLHVPKQRATRGATRQGISEHSGPSMFRTRLSRSSPAISKSNRFPVVLPLLDLNSVISKPHYSKVFFSTDSPMGPFVGSDDHIVRVVNRKGNTCRQARVHWLLASLVCFWNVNLSDVGRSEQLNNIHYFRKVIFVTSSLCHSILLYIQLP